MSIGGRSYSDQSYGAHKTITFGQFAGATTTLATNGIYASYQFTYPARLLEAKIKFGGNGITSGFTDLTQNTEFQLFRSTDSGTGLEAVLGTADALGATGTWLTEDPGLNSVTFDNLTATNFNTGDMLLFTAEGAWDDPINLAIEAEVIELFVVGDN